MQAYVHAFYDIGAGIAEAGIAALEALEKAQEAREKHNQELSSVGPGSTSIPTTAGGAINEGIPAVANVAAKAATGILGTSFTGPAPASANAIGLIGTGAQGAIIGMGTQ